MRLIWWVGLFALSIAVRATHLAAVVHSKYFTHRGLDLLFFDE